jgi:chromosome segregation ATPase
MLNKLAIGLVISVAVLSVAPVFAVAQEEPVTTQNSTTQAAPVSEETTNSSDAEKRDARIKAIKEKAEAKITAAEERRVAGRCIAAQKTVENLQTKMNTVVENRREKYSEITSKLENLVVKLQAASVDTVELEAAIAEVNADVDTALTNIEAYNTSLTDLVGMDCESDPAGFKALVDSAREQRKEIISSHGQLRSRINDSVKPVLQALRERIQLSDPVVEGEE